MHPIREQSTIAVTVPTRNQGNAYYPLPPDYFDLTTEGQRAARVNACRQWLLHSSPGQRHARAAAYVESVRFFEGYYLSREVNEDGSIMFDPMFFRAKLPTPSFHWTWRRYVSMYRNFIGVGPRGGAKSFFHAMNIIHWMVTCPMFGVTYATSTNTLAQEMGDRVKFQMYENPRINDDFSPEYGGDSLKPRRSEGKQGMSSFKLTNRSEFFATSAESRQRGLRPNKYILDDPEWDPHTLESTERNALATERLIFDVALPMVQQAGTSLIWTGTFISLRHYLWQAMMTEEVKLPDGRTVEVTKDKRFRNWTRIISPCEIMGEDGTPRSIWPEMWPVDSQERDRLGLDPDTRTLREIEEDMGTDRFNTEMRCRPGSSKGAFFPALSRSNHGFWLSMEDELFDTCPVRSNARIHWLSYSTPATPEEQAMPVRDLLTGFPRVVLCDATWSNNITSDYRTALVAALTDKNDLLVLDAWAKQCDEDEHVEAILTMSQKWLCTTIGVENIGSGKLLATRLASTCKNRSQDVMGITHWPSVYPFNPGLTRKEVKIARLRWRFAHFKVKLPWYRLDIFPWSMLRSQIANFHPEVRDGGLEKDDLLDTLSFTQYVIGGRPSTMVQENTSPASPFEKMMSGETINPSTGVPYAYEVLYTATPSQVEELLSKYTGGVPPQKEIAL